MGTSVISKQSWLLNTIRRRGRISLSELNRLWQQSTELNPSRKELTYRTMHRHVEFIQDFFGVTIRCDKRFDEYYIDNEDSLSGDDIRVWMLDTVAIDGMICENRQLADRIQLEKIHSGHEHLQMILDAMKDSRKLELTYRSFYSGKEFTSPLEPYFVKAFRQRWYVIGVTDIDTEPYIYALDRVVSLRPMHETFIYPEDFSPEEYFADHFGICRSNGIVMDVKIKVWECQRKYLRSLPLHQSQQEVESNDVDDYSIFAYRLCYDEDLIDEILSKGWRYEVLEPEDLRRDIAERLRWAAAPYSK